MEEARTPEVLGRSLEIVDGDLVLANGDLKPIAGRNNLVQGLMVMIETPLGTDLFNTLYGFDLLNALVVPHSVRLVKELIRLNLVKSLALDDRVLEIREVVFDDDPRFFELIPEADPTESRQERKLQRRWRAALVFTTIAEGEITLALEGPGL